MHLLHTTSCSYTITQLGTLISTSTNLVCIHEHTSASPSQTQHWPASLSALAPSPTSAEQYSVLKYSSCHQVHSLLLCSVTEIPDLSKAWGEKITRRFLIIVVVVGDKSPERVHRVLHRNLTLTAWRQTIHGVLLLIKSFNGCVIIVHIPQIGWRGGTKRRAV